MFIDMSSIQQFESQLLMAAFVAVLYELRSYYYYIMHASCSQLKVVPKPETKASCVYRQTDDIFLL